MVASDEERRARIAEQVKYGAPRNPHYERAPRGLWLVAQSSTRKPYPCRCNPYGTCSQVCACRGRRDRRPELYCCARLHPRREATGATR